jgi:hypothetical protein
VLSSFIGGNTATKVASGTSMGTLTLLFNKAGVIRDRYDIEALENGERM